MIVNCLQISDGPQLTPCEYKFAVDAIRNKNARVWMDVMDSETSELEELLDHINIQGLIRRICLESNDHPGLKHRFGYLIALKIMLLIGAGMYFYYRRKGWFK